MATEFIDMTETKCIILERDSLNHDK